MEENRVNSLLMTCGDKIPAAAYPMVKERFQNASDESSVAFAISQFKDPTVALILAILVPGIDRMYIGDIGLGVLKLITCGGCWIWWIIDIFLIMDAARKKNLERVMMIS